MVQYKAPRGTEDFLPDRLPLLRFITETCRELIEGYGYLEIQTPLFEETSLYVRSIGEVTDIVEKEMFTCIRGDTSVTFRPEATAGVVRAYLENKLDKIRPFRKFYYIGPMFRFERPQAARQRQFHQIGIEAIGSNDPRLDAEIIHIGCRCLEALGIQDAELYLNSVGDRADRDRYSTALADFIRPQLDSYCDDCNKRFERNVFRVLDCKNQSCKAKNKEAPACMDLLGETSIEHFKAVQYTLNTIGREFKIDKGIIRGLDYYTNTVFEIRLPGIGARDTLVGGGRYNNLVEELGGSSTPAIGFSLGVVGTMLALGKAGIAESYIGEDPCPIYICALSEEDELAAFVLAEELRVAGLKVDLGFEGRSLKAQMRQADKRGARIVLILGEEERHKGVVQVKNMEAGGQQEMPQDGDLPMELRRILAGRG